MRARFAELCQCHEGITWLAFRFLCVSPLLCVDSKMCCACGEVLCASVANARRVIKLEEKIQPTSGILKDSFCDACEPSQPRREVFDIKRLLFEHLDHLGMYLHGRSP